MTNTEGLVNDLDRRGQAVGGTARRGDYAMPLGIVLVVVDAEYHVEHVIILERRRHHHPRHVLIEVG